MQPNRIVLLAAVLALAAKLWMSASTVGTTDVVLFNHFGKIINRDGLAHTYETMPLFNHTPLIGTWAATLVADNDGKAEDVGFPLRLPGILADFLAVFVLLRIRQKTGRPPVWALVLFALSPVSLMVSGYHGNVDPVLALMLLVAAWMCVEDRPLLCGLALGLACQVKVVPLLVAPVLAAYWLPRRKVLPFATAAVAVTLAGWAPALVGAPAAFFKNALSYQGYWGIWGVSYLLRETGLPVFQPVGMIRIGTLQLAIMLAGKYLIIGAVLALAWHRRKQDVFTTLAAVWAVFFAFAAGVAPQYCVWVAPFVMLASPRWYVALTAASSIFLFQFYNTISGGLPWVLGNSKNSHIATWGPWSLLPWFTAIGLMVWFAATFWRTRATAVPSAGNPVRSPAAV